MTTGPNAIFARTPPFDLARLEPVRRLSVADLHEALPLARSVEALMASRIRPIVRGLRMAGVAVTSFDAAGNNLMMHKALSLAPRSSVLVATSADRRGALWGELAATYARAAGLAGAVIDANIRDVEGLEAMQFPVWASEVSALRSGKDTAGGVNIPVMCGDVLVLPGDIVAADADGVIVLHPEELEPVLQHADQRVAKEHSLRQAIAQGASLFEAMRLQEVIDRLGIEQIDDFWRP